MLLRVVALLLLAGLILPSRGQAWTKAHVREATARVELGADGLARVLLELWVEVQGGWLERLEVPGLEEDLTLLESEPPSVTLGSGGQVVARAQAQAGTIALRFDKRDGLRRGVHRVHIPYTARLQAQADESTGQASVSWTLPGWQAGLLRAEIVVVGPAGARSLEDASVAQDVQESSAADRSQVRFARVHVPRASPWTVAVALPAAAPGSAKGASDAVLRAAERSGRTGWLLSGLVLVTALLARHATRRRLAAQGLGARTWWSGRPLAWWWLACAAGLGGALWPWSLAASLAAWLGVQLGSLERAGAPLAPLKLGSFVPLSRHDRARLARQRWLAQLGVPWLDASSWCGGLAACGLLLGVLATGMGLEARREPWGLAVLLCLVAWISSARLRLPRGLAEQVGVLEREALRVRTVSCALSLVWYQAGTSCDQPRLRILPSARYPGLLRLEVLVDTRRGAAPLVLSVLTTRGAPAERWARELWPEALMEHEAGGARSALLRPIDDVGVAVEQLLEHFTRESERALCDPAHSHAA